MAIISLEFRPITLGLSGVGADGIATTSILTATGRQLPAPDPVSPAAWSPDGTMLAFTGIAGQKRRETGGAEPLTMVFVVGADGSNLRAVPGTMNGSSPVFSPDGGTIAFAKARRRWRPNEHGGEERVYNSESTWLVDLAGGPVRHLTPWRNHVSMVPTSFSPDGTTLALTRGADNWKREAIAINLSSGGMTLLAHHALEAVYSPDGARIAFLKGRTHLFKTRGGAGEAIVTDLFTMNIDGSGVQRITNTPKAAELAPSWDPAGQRLAYTRLGNFTSEAGFLGVGDAIFEVNSDGSCQTKILSNPAIAYFGSAWQPGPGREAGPISC